MMHLCVLDVRETFHYIVADPLLMITAFFKKLLSPVFGSNSIKAIQKLLVCILQPHDPLTRGADFAVVERYWCLLWTPSTSIAVYIT